LSTHMPRFLWARIGRFEDRPPQLAKAINVKGA